MTRTEESKNPFIPALEIKGKHFRYADLFLYGKKRRLGKTQPTDLKTFDAECADFRAQLRAIRESIHSEG